MIGILKPILSPMSRLYEREITRRNQKFDAGEGVVTLDRPVISVGNLSVGGTGKSPMVAHVVRVLREDGRDPCVAMRGYGAKKTSHGSSDEADEYQQQFPDLPVVAQANRTEGLIELFATERGEAVDVVVLDDGFQHRRIARQLDIVLIDATRPPFEDALLPLGRLRESADSLRRAHAVVITHGESASDAEINALRARILEIKPGLLVAEAEHAWSGLDVTDAEGERTEPVEAIRGKEVLAVCAIGNPGPFLRQVERCAGGQVRSIVLRDHDPFRSGTVQRIRRESAGVDVVVCTAKDWSKLRHAGTESWETPVMRTRLSLRLRAGEAALASMIRDAGATAPE